MKKIGLLALAIVLALGTLGIGYAMWSDTLYINGTVYTGNVDVEFSSQMSNDSATLQDISTGDPAEPGVWTVGDIDTPSTWTWAGAVNMPESKEAASIDCLIDGDTLSVAIDHGYPCYFGGIGFTIDNVGTVPVKILSMKLTSVNGGNIGSGPVDLVAGTQYYVDVSPFGGPLSYAPRVSTTFDSHGFDTDDFSIVISHLAYGQQIGAAGWDDDALFGDIAVHIEQGAMQNAGVAGAGNPPAYTFTIEIVCAQWNEVP